MNNPSDGDLQAGTVLNEKWVILEFIAKGGMGEVYLAHQLSLKRDVAIKIISREWLEACRENEEEFQGTMDRFRNEVQAMAQLSHPNILQIYDYGSFFIGEGDGKVSREYMAMEYAPGGTLKSTMSKEGFYPEEDLTREWLLDYFLPVLDGVQAMHEAGIVHRDLKPGNILMEGNTPKIADFGLARSSRCKPVTQSIDVKGTLSYMAPEQFLDLKRTDHRADLYSLGKILFEAIAGEKSRDAKPLKRADLNNPERPFFKKLDRLIQAATAEDRDERLGSVREMRDSILDALGASVSKGGTRKRSDLPMPRPFQSVLQPRKRVWGGIILAAILLFLVGFWHWQDMERSKKNTPFPEGLQITSEKQGGGTKPSEPGKAGYRFSGSLPKTLEGKDGVTLGLVPGGKFTFPDNFGVDSGKTVNISPFYMDETRVTNHQYVEFLNKVLSKVHVERGVVQSQDEVWLLLGEVFEGYEPIVFRDGKFHVNQPEHASCPVLRVTGYGASAYARFYGRRLPTEAEWLYALVEGAEMKKTPPGNASEPIGNAGTGDSMSAMMSEMHEGTEAPAPGSVDLSPMPPPVMLSKPNAYGIRGLEERIGEWALWGKEASTDGQEGERQYVILRGVSGGRSKGTVSPSGVTRQPWEAFGDVSFRCVLSSTDVQR
jgi:serine/threonine protein kinase